MKFSFTSRLLARQALIAAFYAVITLAGFGISYGPIQFRFSELLNWLVFFDPKNVIGLTIGCFLSNIPSPLGAIDMFVGTLGTLLATLCMAKSKNHWIASIWPAVFSFLYSGESLFLGQIPGNAFVAVTGQIMLSELIIVAVIGIPVAYLLSKSQAFRKAVADDTMLPTRESWTHTPAFPGSLFQL